MWSPKTNKNGGYNQFYQNMTETNLGDIIFSFADTFIKTVGVVSAPAISADKPKEFGKAGDAWDIDGWLVRVDYEELNNPFKPKKTHGYFSTCTSRAVFTNSSRRFWQSSLLGRSPRAYGSLVIIFYWAPIECCR